MSDACCFWRVRVLLLHACILLSSALLAWLYGVMWKELRAMICILSKVMLCTLGRKSQLPTTSLALSI